MKLIALFVCLAFAQSIWANDAFSKKCIELGGTSENHGVCHLTLKVANKRTDANILISANLDDQKDLLDTLGKSCTIAAENNPNALMQTDYFLNNSNELNLNLFCFISIE